MVHNGECYDHADEQQINCTCEREEQKKDLYFQTKSLAGLYGRKTRVQEVNSEHQLTKFFLNFCQQFGDVKKIFKKPNHQPFSN